MSYAEDDIDENEKPSIWVPWDRKNTSWDYEYEQCDDTKTAYCFSSGPCVIRSTSGYYVGRFDAEMKEVGGYYGYESVSQRSHRMSLYFAEEESAQWALDNDHYGYDVPKVPLDATAKDIPFEVNDITEFPTVPFLDEQCQIIVDYYKRHQSVKIMIGPTKSGYKHEVTTSVDDSWCDGNHYVIIEDSNSSDIGPLSKAGVIKKVLTLEEDGAKRHICRLLVNPEILYDANAWDEEYERQLDMMDY